MSKQLLGVVPFVQPQGAFPNCCWKSPVHLTLQEPSFSRIRQSMREGPSQHVTNQQLEPEQWKDIERNGKTKKLPALCNSLMTLLLPAVTQRLQSYLSELHFWWCHGTSASQICLIWWSKRSEARERQTMWQCWLIKTSYAPCTNLSAFKNWLLVRGQPSKFSELSNHLQLWHKCSNSEMRGSNGGMSYDFLRSPLILFCQASNCANIQAACASMNKTSIALHQLTPTFNTFGFFWPKLGAKCPYEVYVWISKAQPLASIVGITSVEWLFEATA